MVMDVALKKALIEDCAKVITAHADELTSLDQAIGDGDHGVNMKRGFESLLADADALAARPLPDMLKAIGTQLVMKVGGASGPLYGTLFLSLAVNRKWVRRPCSMCWPPFLPRGIIAQALQRIFPKRRAKLPTQQYR